MGFSFSFFSCGPSDPNSEWFLCLLLIGLLYVCFFVLYSGRLISVKLKNFNATLSALSPRIFFSITLLVKAGAMICQAFGFENGTRFSVFKFVITDLPDYLLASALTAVLYSWCVVFSKYGMVNTSVFNFELKTLSVIFNSFTLLGFFVLFLLRCSLPERLLSGWHLAETSFELLRRILLVIMFIVVLHLMKKRMGLAFKCGLGNPEHYIFTLCTIVIGLQLVQIFFDLLLAIYGDNQECSEMRLVLTVLFECIGDAVPLGFISIVDVIQFPIRDEIPMLTATIFDDGDE